MLNGVQYNEIVDGTQKPKYLADNCKALAISKDATALFASHVMGPARYMVRIFKGFVRLRHSLRIRSM